MDLLLNVAFASVLVKAGAFQIREAPAFIMLNNYESGAPTMDGREVASLLCYDRFRSRPSPQI